MAVSAYAIMRDWGYMDKKKLTETDIRTKYITPAIIAAVWDIHTQVFEEYGVADGRIMVRGRLQNKNTSSPKLMSYPPYATNSKPVFNPPAKLS